MQLGIVRHFLTSFDTKDTWIYEKEKILLGNVPNTAPPPGLSDLKQVQLFINYRNFVPPIFKDNVCPKSPDLVIEKVKIQKKEKNKARKDKKKTYDDNVSNEAMFNS